MSVVIVLALVTIVAETSVARPSTVREPPKSALASLRAWPKAPSRVKRPPEPVRETEMGLPSAFGFSEGSLSGAGIRGQKDACFLGAGARRWADQDGGDGRQAYPGAA